MKTFQKKIQKSAVGRKKILIFQESLKMFGFSTH